MPLVPLYVVTNRPLQYNKVAQNQSVEYLNATGEMIALTPLKIECRKKQMANIAEINVLSQQFSDDAFASENL